MIIRWIVSLILNAVALIAVAQLFDSFHLEGFGTAVLASFILAILNIIVKPIIVILTLPITIVTFGLFLIVINAITLMITQALIGSSFVIDGFGIAIIASIIISLITMILNSLVRDSVR
ncbi:phage holin family protein [Oceanobacillus kimchii]|uniref:phage holin family protein n=1 Tax=Oceanobacillus kimchii TaxID=746691 RepID=UPI0021A65C71|nr:phage holin family protein [Oceanobacillus kimchii]MCT1578009.1 phage holin family protein [Oceanobacillus kimchii]MCT2137569.1 phage holin family protein [Oceanobacillus kimchii]